MHKRTIPIALGLGVGAGLAVWGGVPQDLQAGVRYALAFVASWGLLVARAAWLRARGTAPRHPARMSSSRARSVLVTQLVLVELLWLSHLQGMWSAESVGLRYAGAARAAVALVLGAGAYLLLGASFTAAGRLLGFGGELRRAQLRVNARLWPRTRGAKIAAGAAIGLLNPLTEELLMRGVLVCQWSQLMGSIGLPILVGLALNGLLHSYQGWRTLLWHTSYFALASALLFSPLGLMGAIGAHFAGDSVPIVLLGRQARSLGRRALATPGGFEPRR